MCISTHKNRRTRLKKFLTTFIFPSSSGLKQCVYMYYFMNIAKVLLEYFKTTATNFCLETWLIVVVLVRLHRTASVLKCTRPNISGKRLFSHAVNFVIKVSYSCFVPPEPCNSSCLL